MEFNIGRWEEAPFPSTHQPGLAYTLTLGDPCFAMLIRHGARQKPHPAEVRGRIAWMLENHADQGR